MRRFVSFHSTTIANLSNETRFVRFAWNEIRVDPLFLSSSSHCRVNRRSSIKILPGWTMSVPVKRNWSRLISKLDASSNAFSRGLQLTGRNNDSFNPVRQRVLKDGPSAVGHEMKRIYGNYKVYAASKPVESSYEFHWPRTAINENLLISRQLCFIFRAEIFLIVAFYNLFLRAHRFEFSTNYICVSAAAIWYAIFVRIPRLFNNRSRIYLFLFVIKLQMQMQFWFAWLIKYLLVKFDKLQVLVTFFVR